MRRLLPAALATWSGCLYVPLATAPAPLSRTTGGGAGASLMGEYPALELSTLPVTPPDPAAPHAYPRSPYIPFILAIRYGLSSDLDLEATTDFIVPLIPIPNGAGLGLRWQALDHEAVEATLGARWAFLRRRSNHDEFGGDVTVTGGTASLGGAVRLKVFARPGVALNLQPVYAVFRDKIPDNDLWGVTGVVSASLVLPLGTLEVMPMVYAGAVHSNNVRGTAWYAGFGMAIATVSRPRTSSPRRRRRRRPGR